MEKSDYLNLFATGKFRFIPNAIPEIFRISHSLAQSGEKLVSKEDQIKYTISVLEKELLPYETIKEGQRAFKALLPYEIIKEGENFSGGMGFIGGATIMKPRVLYPRNYRGYAVDGPFEGEIKGIHLRAPHCIEYYPESIVNALVMTLHSKTVSTDQLRFLAWSIIGHERAHTTQKIIGGFLISPEIQVRYLVYGAMEKECSMEERYAYWQGLAFAKRRLAGIETTY